MRWIRNLPQIFRRLWNERRGPALAAAALLALAAVLVLGWIISASQGEHELIKVLRTRSEAAQREAEQTSAETPTDAATDASNPQDRTLEEWAEIVSKRALTQDEYYGEIVNGYPATSGTAFSKVAVIIDSEHYYIGPQTAEALMVYVNLHPSVRHKYAGLKAHYQRMLDRGVVFQDSRDIGYYGLDLYGSILEARNYESDTAKTFFEINGVPEGNWAELEEAMIQHALKTVPIRKEQFRHHFQTGEGTVNLQLDPDFGAIHMSVVSGENRRKFTDEEIYKMTHYGIAPKGYRLRIVKDLWYKEEIPFDQAPFFSERKYVKHLSRDGLNALLKAIPSLMSQPKAQDYSDADWMSMAGRYEAALEELASRGYVPEPFANRQPSASSPPGVVRSAAPPGTTAATAPPVEQREPTAPPVEARDEAALEKEAQKRRVAEAFLNALEKEAEKAKITPEDRSLIARRLRELRIMKNPDLLKPPAPPSSSEEESEEDDAP